MPGTEKESEKTKNKDTMMKRFLPLLALLCAACLVFSGCVGSVQQRPDSSATLPPAHVPYDAPTGETDARRDVTAQLYLPSPDGTHLIAVNRSVRLSPYRLHADALVNALFAYEGEEAQRLPRAENLMLQGPVEVSCGVATVNLAPQALALSHEQLYTVFQSLTNTLCQFDGITGVNLLISGVQPGLDVASQTPAGTLHENHTDDLSTLWSRASAQKNATSGTQRLTQDVTLYFPAPAGMGVVSECRTLAFSSPSLPQMADTLLTALSEGAATLTDLPPYPTLSQHLAADPAVNEMSGEKVLTLRFHSTLNNALLENGITRSCMVASMVYTMTTYLPGIAGVEIYIGDEKVTSITPEGTYQGAGETILFENGVMRRNQFSIFLLSRCTLYFADHDGTLEKVYRAVPYYEARNAAYLLEQLILGPQFYDWTEQKHGSVLPEGMTEGDLMGTGYGENGVALINLSPRFLDLCQGMTREEERLMVYSMVNTLTELSGIDEVCFFINGKQPDTFAGSISLPGTFLRNVDLIAR